MKNPEEEFKKKMEDMRGFDIKGLADMLHSEMNKVTPILKTIGEEQQKLQRPKARKDVPIYSKNVICSLLIDGRIILTFQTTDEADNFYDVFGSRGTDPGVMIKRANDLEDEFFELKGAYAREVSKPWYKKIFRK